MRRVIIGIGAVAILAGLLFAMLGDSAPKPISDWWQQAFGSGGPVVRANAGFAEYRAESDRVQDQFPCARFIERPGDEFSDRRRHCFIGEHLTVRVSIYEPVGHEGLTKKVKLTWFDNERPNAQNRNAPRHADREDARQAVRQLSALYMPGHEDQLMALFTRQQDGVVTELPFTAVATFVKRQGVVQAEIDMRDGNHDLLVGSEERQSRPGFERCRFILSNIPALDGVDFSGEPNPDRSDLYVTYYFLSKTRPDEKFLCEIHNSGYYRIRVSQGAGQPFKVMAHGDLGGN